MQHNKLHCPSSHAAQQTTLRLQLFEGTNFCFFAIVSKTAKFYTCKILIYEEMVMNVINRSELANFNTSKMDGTPKPQTNLPVEICHFKVYTVLAPMQHNKLHSPSSHAAPISKKVGPTIHHCTINLAVVFNYQPSLTSDVLGKLRELFRMITLYAARKV